MVLPSTATSRRSLRSQEAKSSSDVITASRAATTPSALHFAEQLAAHARTEEEMMYPAALLIGQWAKQRLQAWE